MHLLILVVVTLLLSQGIGFKRSRYLSSRVGSALHTLMMSKFAEDASLYDIDVHEVHDKLVDIVERHVLSLELFEEHNHVAAHTEEAFEEALAFVDSFYRENGDSNEEKLVIIDSGCGKGLSTFTIASANPGIPVIGIDRSINRLSKSEIFIENQQDKDNESSDKPENALLLRAELSNFWTLMVKEPDWVVHSHYILYPNPYPKGKHVGRRWHGHPIFPYILALGGCVKVRSNWHIYCEETKLAAEAALPFFPPWYSSEVKVATQSYQYARAVEAETATTDDDEVFFDPVPMTHFERKYMNLAVQLYQAEIKLPRVSREQRKAMLEHIRSRQ